jgi:membrane-associated PAP2 superfamily phosphatase
MPLSRTSTIITALALGLAVGLLGSLSDNLLGAAPVVQIVLWGLSTVLLIAAAVGVLLRGAGRRGRGPRDAGRRVERTHPGAPSAVR